MTKACYAIVTVFLLKRQAVNTRVALLLKRQSVNTIFQIRIHCNVDPDPDLQVHVKVNLYLDPVGKN